MLQIKNLTKIYKTKGGADTRALDDVTVSFPETGMIFLLGKSGSGKSTLLNVSGGLDYPTSGEIILKGRSSKDFSQSDFDSYRNTYIGFIFQEYNVLNEFNIEQNIALALELQGKKATKEAVENLLEQVDLKGFAKRKPNTLSGGQKQRIAIARALIKEPNIIMADEPTGALDSKTGEQVFETLKKLSKDKLVLVVSHDRDFAERFGDRIIELKDGKIVSDISKHQIEAKPISDNVTIINDNAISINDAKKLTKADFEKLYDAIKNSEGKVFISSGENADKSMKASRISAEGKSDEFKRTESVKLRIYDGSQTKFIRSKMPVGKSVKMGLSSLKTKPVRLIFTILLSVISFTMFGVASSLMLYNSSHTYSEALSKTDYLSEKLEKRVNGKYVSQEVDGSGNVLKEYKSDSSQQELYGVEEINKLNNNNLGLVYIPIGELNTSLQINGLTMKKYADFYQDYRIDYISDAKKSDFDKLGYKLDGSYPVNDDELLLPKLVGQMLVETEAVNKTNYLNLIGESFQFVLSKNVKTMKISGFFDAGDIPERYLDLKNREESTKTDLELRDLGQELLEFISGSFNCVVFSNSKTFDENVRKSSSSYVETYRRTGLLISRNSIDWEVPADNWFECYTADTIKENSSSFIIYDTDGNSVDSSTISIAEDEIYLSEYEFNDAAYENRRMFFDEFFRITPFDDWYGNPIRFMPQYYNYYVDHADDIDNIRDSLWMDQTPALQLFNQYKNEYKKAYKIVKLYDVFCNTYYFENNVSNEDKILISEALGNEMGTNTAETVNKIYSIFEEHFDAALPNFFYYRYINDLHTGGKDSVRLAIEGNSDLMDILSKSYQYWSPEECQTIKDFVDANYATGFNYKNWEYVVRGYTFIEFDPVPDSVFAANKNLEYYYRDYNNGKGKLTVKGYYVDEYNFSYILNKTFVDNHSLKPQDDGTYWRSFFESEYQTPADARYNNVMVKTNYTQDQISYMLKSNDPLVKYSMTSSKYATVSFIVEMIGVLKNVFLWVGVGFGIFSALMLLNFITVSVASKKKDIGILRAIGARKSDVFKIFFVESLFIAAICSLISIIGAFIAQFFLDRYFVQEIGISVMQFSPITVGLIVVIAVFISFVATIIPVINASRKPPVESIRAL